MTTFFRVIFPTKIVSSTYCNEFTSTFSLPTLYLVNMFFEEASLTNPLRPSSTMVKSKGDKGSPCLNPFFQLEFLSWTSIYKDRNQSRNKTPFNPFDPFFIKSQSTQQVIKKFSTYKIVCLLKIHSKQQTFLPLPLSLINHFISYDGPMQKISTYKECI